MDCPKVSLATFSPSRVMVISRCCASSGEFRLTVKVAGISKLGKDSSPVSAGFAARVRKSGIGKIGDFEFGDGTPEALEIIEAARLFGENVNEEAAEIEESPFGRTVALAMLGFAL